MVESRPEHVGETQCSTSDFDNDVCPRLPEVVNPEETVMPVTSKKTGRLLSRDLAREVGWTRFAITAASVSKKRQPCAYSDIIPHWFRS